MKPSRSLEERIDRLAGPHDEAAMPGPTPPEGRALMAWGEAVADGFADVDPAAADDDWKAKAKAFREAVLEYAAALDEIGEA